MTGLALARAINHAVSRRAGGGVGLNSRISDGLIVKIVIFEFSVNIFNQPRSCDY